MDKSAIKLKLCFMACLLATSADIHAQYDNYFNPIPEYLYGTPLNLTSFNPVRATGYEGILIGNREIFSQCFCREVIKSYSVFSKSSAIYTDSALATVLPDGTKATVLAKQASDSIMAIFSPIDSLNLNRQEYDPIAVSARLSKIPQSIDPKSMQALSYFSQNLYLAGSTSKCNSR